ncbi:MAG: hypothetical protein A2W08_05275 [Candidatus Rokubacteria bacterium RBG_16_73_20]|nr:MAG: hypothetical protein A2050_11530 [Candidatus Rokubacteria bacterium GWA2_73_35]OGK96102.1 MAG: hypothetical protein A2W08_05275 [Candidatus Rokubacteria bacterium RBG_16_73_20]HBH04603.1 hypothetical protein [Candidatus Rokubacteria bacterium]
MTEPGAPSTEPLRCDWCGEEIRIGNPVFYLAQERKLVHQKCPRRKSVPVPASQDSRTID